MADNYETQPGVGGVIFRSDEDVGGVHWPVIKLAWGADDTFNEVDDSAGKRIPVVVGNFPTDFAINNFPAGFLAAQSGAWSVSIIGTVPVSGPLTDTELRASAVPVSGTFFQATQPISAAALPLPAGAATSALQTQPGVDIGDVTVNNGAGAGAVNIQDGGNSITVDGPLTDAQLRATSVPVTATLVAGGDVDVLTVPADPFGVNADAASATGSISAKLRFIAATGIPITALPASTNTLEVVGDVAHDSPIGGNPVRTGGRAMSADFAAVATGDTTDSLHSLTGKQVVMPHALPGASESYASPAAVTDTADDVAFAAAGAGIRHYVTGVQFFNSHDTVGTEIVIKDGSTVLWRGWGEEKGGGASVKLDPPLRGTANTAVNVANITTGSSTYFNLQGYQAAE